MRIAIARRGKLSASVSLAFFVSCLAGPVLPSMAQQVATGDSRQVSEPVFPPVCQQLSASFKSIQNTLLAGPDGLDLPLSVDTPPAPSNPDGARIQAALNACSADHPGEAVELSASGGNDAFLTGPLSMPSNVTLLVDPDVTVFFSRNVQDYDSTPGVHTCGTSNSKGDSTNSCKPLIDIPGTSTNVGIMGYGKLDGRGEDPLLNGFQTPGNPAPTSYTWWNLAAVGNQQNPIMIQPESHASNITLYKITLMNSPMFHLKDVGSASGLTAWDVKIVTPTYTRNTDGIDPQQAQNFTVTDSWISDGDDDIAVGGSGSPDSDNSAKNISITNNHFFAGHGESIGSYTDAGVSNVLFDHNILAGDAVSGHGSAINATPFTINGTTYPADFADDNSTAIRIKSAYNRGGLITDIQYSNSCFLDHYTDISFNPIYSSDKGTLTPDMTNILLKNLSFQNTDSGAGTLEFLGADNTTPNPPVVDPLQVTLSNVMFPSALALSDFVAGAETNAQLTYGPGDVSNNFISDWATFVANAANGDTATDNISVRMLNPPFCHYTYIAPELTGPNGRPQVIEEGQTATLVVILTPAVGGAAYPTGTVRLSDGFFGKAIDVALPGNTDTFSVPIYGLRPGRHIFFAAYLGDANYTPARGQWAYSFAGPYEVTVLPRHHQGR